MSNHPQNPFQPTIGNVPRTTGQISLPVVSTLPMGINTTASVFDSPDKSSMAELHLRAMAVRARLDMLTPTEEVSINWEQVLQAQVQQQRAASTKNNIVAVPPLSLAAAIKINNAMQKRVLQQLPKLLPPAASQLPESLVREIMLLIRDKYPWAESVLASKMTPIQFEMVLDKLPQLKNMITSRLPQPLPVAATQSPTTSTPKAAQQPPPPPPPVEKGEPGKEKEKKKRNVSIKCIEFMLNIKKIAEIGVLDEDILDQPLSPITLSMIYLVVQQIKKLVEVRKQVIAGKLKSSDEDPLKRRLLEMREYIREEQKSYLEVRKRKPASEVETIEQILKDW